ncbi:MAG: ArnT family glycosyltransferase [Actinomycetota bacterium]
MAFRIWLLVLVALNLFARLPLCWDPATVDNDGAEYLAIARHLRASGKYATDLKWQFYTDDPVRHAAWADRPPLYPYLAAASQRALFFAPPTAAARLANAMLACLTLALCAAYLRRLYDERTALLAAGFVFLLPHTLKWTTQPMTETVTLALTFGALLLWSVREDGDRRKIAVWGFGAGILAGLAYLARPTGAVVAVILIADALRRRSPGARVTAVWVAAGFALCALPYHGWLWRLYGDPLHSALGFTFAVKTYYEVTYYGYGQPPPTTAGFLASHWTAIPGLVLHQVWRHIQIVVPQLLPFLPFAGVRVDDQRNERWAGWALVVALATAHTITWAAWGSSRYFIAALPVVVAALLWREKQVGEAGGPQWLVSYQRWALPIAAAGLLVCLANFYLTAASPTRGLASLPAWRAAAVEVADAQVIASDKPSILNLLLETPAVRLPRTTDPWLLARFAREFAPEAMVLFADEPAEAPMAEAWRAGQLPAGWRLTIDRGELLVLRPEAPSTSEPRP